MKIILKNIEYENDCIYVTGVTSIGSIKGIWSYSEKPIIDQEYFCELSINDINRNEISVVRNTDFHSKVLVDKREVIFKGVCEEIDEIYVIRFAEDWIEMIAIIDDDFSIKKGDSIQFSTNCECISIYPWRV